MLPKPRCTLRLERLRKMTVAAGYVCNEGVVLCADTQESIPGYTKTAANKLMAFQFDKVTLVFAGAGNNAVQVDETVYEIARNIEEAAQNGVQLRKALRKCLGELFPREHYPRPGGHEVDILMAVQSNTGIELLRIADCNVAPVAKMVCIGSGVVLGAQLLERHYNRKVSLFDAALISLYVLYHVKQWVDGCGGKTDIAIISKADGKMSFMPTDEVEKIEKYCGAYDDAIKGLLTATPRHPKDRAAFDAQVEAAKQRLVSARTAFQDWEDVMREVATQLGKSYEDMEREAEEWANSLLGQSAPKNQEGVKE